MSEAKMTEPVIRLRYCSVRLIERGARTTFSDGSSVEGHCWPNDPHYAVISHRTGYLDDIRAYAAEHEFVHAFTQQVVRGRPSPVLWAKAHGHELSGLESVEEEVLVAAFQRYLRGNEVPIIGGIDWAGWKAEALVLLRAWH